MCVPIWLYKLSAIDSLIFLQYIAAYVTLNFRCGMKRWLRVLCGAIFTLLCLFPDWSFASSSSSSEASVFTCDSDKQSKTESFKHNIQLQLYDTYGVPVPGTEFWVTLKVVKVGNKVTLQFPAINFQTGPYANNLYEPPTNPYSPAPPPSPPYPPVAGGYIYTTAGYLPKHVRPTDIINRSWLAPS